MSIQSPAWVKDAVFYQAFPDRLARSGRVEAPGELEPWDAPPTVHGFKGGDLYGVVDHLDRLQRLGITALYLNPVFTSASNHRYHTDDYYSVDPLLGGDAALRELLDEAHARDMRVVLDGVFNHTGRGFWPFHHVLENGVQSPYRDWFHLHEDVRVGDRALLAFPREHEFAELRAMREAGALEGSTSPAVLGYEAWSDLPALPKLNLHEPHVREMMLDVAEYWLRFGIDGWRLDVAEEVGADFWREFRRRVRAVNPEAYLVAEIWHPLPEWLHGDMFDAFMNYPLLQAIVGFVAAEQLDRSIEMPAEWGDGLPSLDAVKFWSLIEELEALNDPAVTASQLNLLGSHDTPRLRTVCGGALDSVRLATLLQMTLPGAPCIYYGDEIGMTGSMDPGCRRSFPNDPSEWERDPYSWTADLIALRHSSRALRDGALELLVADGQALALLRHFEGDVFVVVVNGGDAAFSWDLQLPVDPIGAEFVPIGPDLSPGRAVGPGEGGDPHSIHVELPGRDGAVIRITKTDQ